MYRQIPQTFNTNSVSYMPQASTGTARFGSYCAILVAILTGPLFMPEIMGMVIPVAPEFILRSLLGSSIYRVTTQGENSVPCPDPGEKIDNHTCDVPAWAFHSRPLEVFAGTDRWYVRHLPLRARAASADES